MIMDMPKIDNRPAQADDLKIELAVPVVTLRPARLSDVPAMLALLADYARRAEILPRREGDIYQTIREWVVAEAGGQIVGAGSLAILWADLAEIRSLVVDPARQGQGIGRRIVRHLLTEANRMGLPAVFALTRKPNFFLKLGFAVTQKEKLPRKILKDCIFCPKLKACDETAVILNNSGKEAWQ